MDKLITYGATVGRILIASIFVIAGYNKIFGFESAQGYMEKFGVSGMLLPLVIVTELGGGLALAAGWQTRIVAFLLAGFTLIAAVIFHGDIADRMQYLFFLKNVAIAGGLLAVVSHGPGPLSLDNHQ